MARRHGSYTSNRRFYRMPFNDSFDSAAGEYEKELYDNALELTDIEIGNISDNFRVNSTSNSISIGYSSASYTEIEADGTIKYVGGARVWRDEKVRVGTAKLHPTATPSWVNYQGGMVIAFDGSADNTIYFEAQLNHDYDTGENIEFHVHYVPEDATAGNHRWKLGYTWASIGSTFASQATVAKIIAAPGVANQHSIAAISATIIGTNKGISSVLICELTRTASHSSDTYNGKHIKLISADFHYPCDTTGSRERLEK